MNTDNVPFPEIVAVESQPLFSSAEPDAANSAVGTPPDTEIKDAEIIDAEESGRAARSDPAVPAEPGSGLPPSSDPGIFDPGPAT